MAISWTPTFANAGSAGFGSSYTASSQTLGTGDIVVFVFNNIGGLSPWTPPSVTVAGVSANLIGSVSDSSNLSISVYLASGVSSSTGNIVVSATVMGDIALAGGLITGESPVSATVTGVDNLGQSDPQQATGSVPTGGIGIAFIAAAGNTTSPLPTTWTAGEVGTWTASSTMEAYSAGNAACSGASTTTTGSVTASAAGAVAQSWAFGNGGIAMVTFSASGGGAVAFGLGTPVQEYGLNAFALANNIVICSAMPTSYANAVSLTLGTMAFGIGSCFGSITDYSGPPPGNQLSSVAVTAGSVTANGTPDCWAVLDDANSRLLAWGPLTGATAVTADQSWTLASFTIQVPVQ
jgi:hypothetical protein